MPGIPLVYAETFNRLKRATDQLHLLMESGEFYTFGYVKRRKLLRRVRKLYNRLAGPVSPLALRGALTAAGVLVMAGCFQPTGTGYTPVFGAAQADPFGLGFTDSYERIRGTIVLADIDGDGDLDLLTTVYAEGLIPSIAYNIGTAQLPSFDPIEPVNGTGMTFPSYYSTKLLAAGDVDGDGDIDLLAAVQDGSVYGYTNHLRFFENTDTTADRTMPSFPTSAAVAGGTFSAAEAASFADFDDDGDLDIVTVGRFEALPQFKGLTTTVDAGDVSFTPVTGTPALLPEIETVFTDPYSYPYTYFRGLAIADIDGDGDQDVLISGTYGEGYGSTPFLVAFGYDDEEPAGIKKAVIDGLEPPDFYWGAYDAGSMSLAAADLDDDGDLDLLVGPSNYREDPYSDWNATFYFLENLALPTTE